MYMWWIANVWHVCVVDPDCVLQDDNVCSRMILLHNYNYKL